MQRIDILLTGDLAGGFAPFRHGDLELVLHRWSSAAQLPLIEGALWAFVDWVLPEMSGLELVRRLRCDREASGAEVGLVEGSDVGVRHVAVDVGGTAGSVWEWIENCAGRWDWFRCRTSGSWKQW